MRYLLPRLLILLGIGTSAYLLLFGGEYSLFTLRQLKQEQEQEQERLEALYDTVEALTARADSLESDSALLERIAREHFGLVRPGERLYRFIGTPPVFEP